MKMPSPVPKKKARIEIIPLIDIMFFLLASFMMVSLSQTHMKGILVTLPSPGQAQTTPPPDKEVVSLRVTEGGLTYIDNQPVNDQDVLPRLFQMAQANAEQRVSISAEQLAMHGDVITLLDRVRSSGIHRIGYQVRTAAAQGAAP
ncbi:biopolymer transporter ExbD [soil metagenome]|jgi:biopolymer transport protein ExbD